MQVTRRGYRTATEAARARRDLIARVDVGAVRPSSTVLTVNELLDLYLDGLDADEQFRFTFAANEAVANAIEHGAASPEGHIVVRSSSSAAGDLTFEVRDWGTFTPHLSEADALPDRGRGLALMATMVDEVDVAPTGDSTVVRLVMRARSKAA